MATLTQADKRTLLYCQAWTGLALGAAFLAYGLQDVIRHIAGHKALTSLSWEALTVSPGFVLDIGWFALAYFGGHIAVAILFGLAAIVLTRKAPLHPRDVKSLAILLTLVFFLWTVLANFEQFPQSRFTPLGLGERFPAHALSMGLLLLLAVPLLTCTYLFVERAWHLIRALRPKLAWAVFLLAGLPAGSVFYMASIAQGSARPTDAANVILIGIDSLRPDYLFGRDEASALLPNIQNHIRASAYFPETYTPLARTFPAWMSILTGHYPPGHGARFNLMPAEDVDAVRSIAHRFVNAGYATVYATDERRFSNIGEQHGFQTVIGPKMGMGDFVLGELNDFPLTNLIANTWLGKFLFPFTYSNRAAHVTYRPSTFMKNLESGLPRTDRPLFLAIHLTLPHWPYTWNEPRSAGPLQLSGYERALAAADRQFAELMNLMRQRGLLSNATVVLLSDHGEALSADPSAWTAAVRPALRENITTDYRGHGTHVFNADQNRVLLSFRKYGGDSFPAGPRSGQTSLVDIAPTVTELTAQKRTGRDFDGRSLVDALHQADVSLEARHLFLETGFAVQGLLGDDIRVEEVAAQAAGFYDLGGDGLLSLRVELIEQLLEAKQRAVLYKDWTLASIPAPGKSSVLTLAHHPSRTWWPESAIGTAAAPTKSMLSALCAHFAGDPGFPGERICSASPHETLQ